MKIRVNFLISVGFKRFARQIKSTVIRIHSTLNLKFTPCLAVTLGYGRFFILLIDQQSSQNAGRTFFCKNIIDFFQSGFCLLFGVGARKFHPKM